MTVRRLHLDAKSLVFSTQQYKVSCNNIHIPAPIARLCFCSHSSSTLQQKHPKTKYDE